MALRKLISAVGAIGLTLAGLVASAPSASATVYLCSPNSESEAYNSWTSTAKPWTVTHATRYEHYVSGSGKYTKTAAMQVQLSAEYTYSSSVHAGVGFKIVDLGATVGVSLKAAGNITTSKSITISETMSQYDAYIFYDGSRKASGAYDHYSCNSAGSGFVKKWSGKVTSYDEPASGAVACSSNPPSSSLGYVAKQKYC